MTAGKDATEDFFSLHRQEILHKPQYSRLVIGSLVGAEQQIFPKAIGALSKVLYAEPIWLTPGYHSPYYKDVRITDSQLDMKVEIVRRVIGNSNSHFGNSLRTLSCLRWRLVKRMANTSHQKSSGN